MYLDITEAFREACASFHLLVDVAFQVNAGLIAARMVAKLFLDLMGEREIDEDRKEDNEGNERLKREYIIIVIIIVILSSTNEHTLSLPFQNTCDLHQLFLDTTTFYCRHHSSNLQGSERDGVLVGARVAPVHHVIAPLHEHHLHAGVVAGVRLEEVLGFEH